MRTRLLLLAVLCSVFASGARAVDLPFEGAFAVSSLVNQSSVQAADLDRDGDLDLVSITQSAGGAVTWFENTNGSGTSWSAHTIATKVATGSTLCAVDLDGDGDLDVLATLPSANETVWYQNTAGNGSTWAAALTVNDTGSGQVSSAAGDFDRDGDLDVAIGSAGTIRWFVNQSGNGSSWSAANPVGTLIGATAVHLDVADVDSDGRLDVAAAWDHASSAGVAWYRNTGTFAQAAFYSLGSDSPIWVATGRIGADGHLDLVATTESGVIFWLANADGTGTTLTLHPIVSSGSGPLSALPFDVDADGDTDLVVPLLEDFVWYENVDRFGDTWAAHSVPVPEGTVPSSAAVGDIDRDGDPDLIATGNDAVFFAENASNPSSSFLLDQVPVAQQQAVSLAVGDFDSSGAPDFLSASFDGNSLSVHLNGGDPEYWPEFAVTVAPAGPIDVAAVDFDRDGEDDALVAGQGADVVRWYKRSPMSWNDPWTSVLVSTRQDPASVSAADIDGDGDPDALAAFTGDDVFAWYENTAGDGSAFSEHVIASGVADAIDAGAVDVDRDGDLDVVALTLADSTVRWYENTAGNGSAWSAHVIAATTSSGRALALGDVDRDGDVDAVSYGSNRLAWYENTSGNGSTWSTIAVSTATVEGQAVALSDYDRDGDLDLIAAPGATSAATRFENEGGTGDTWTSQAIAGTTSPPGGGKVGLATADIQPDGSPDLMLGNVLPSQLTLHRNTLAQVDNPGTNLAPAVMTEGTTSAVLAIDARNEARTGESNAILATFGVRFEDSRYQYLSIFAPPVNALIDNVYLYADDGDNLYDAGDTLVLTVPTLAPDGDGWQYFALNTALPALAIAPQATRRYFVVVQIGASASSEVARWFQAWASTEFVDDDPNPLSASRVSVTSASIVAASSTSDYDGDGAPDTAETNTDVYVSASNRGTDPTDSDSDDDGFSDGFEVVARTNPNLLASAPPSMPYVAVEAGLSTTSCGILSDGEVSCFGANTAGIATPPAGAFRQVTIGDGFACGLGANDALSCWGSSSWQVVNASDPNYVQIAAGQQHVCGLQVDLGLECWGTNSFGLFTPPAGRFHSLVSGEDFSCALNLAGVPVCWGNPANGRTTPPAGQVFTEIGAGSGHACGVREDGTVLCWGLGTSGQTTVPPETFTHVAPGSGFSCGTRSDGALRCWGSISTTISSASPYISVSAGRYHVCAVRADGVVTCAGNNYAGEGTPRVIGFRHVALGEFHTCTLGASRRITCVGDNASGKSSPPVTSDIAAIGLGNQHSCAIEQDGDAVCFGANTNGQATSQSAPGNPFVQIDGGEGHTCGVRADGGVNCWGSDLAPGQSSPDPGSYVQVSAGGINSTNAHSCGITTAGALRCWGTNAVGQATDQSGTWTQVSAGQAFSCGVRTDGTLGCFGHNGFGQVSGAPATGIFSEVAAARFHACARESNGTVRCWGDASGGKTSPPPGKFVQIAAVADRSCGVLENGSVACWGENYIGETWPPLDGDYDSREDAADNCPVSGNFQQTDADFDGVGDSGCDLCLGVSDPDRLDRDGDGVGDACDNCVDVYNPGQEDNLGPPDGVGNACDSTLVFIRPAVPPPAPPPGAPSGPGPASGPGTPLPPPAGEALYDVFLYCPAVPIQKVQLGVIMPEGATAANVNFGLGCTSTSCAGAVNNGLGTSVNAAASFAKGPDALFAADGARGDTVYFSLQAPTGATLCDPVGPELEVRVAQFQVANPAAGAPTPSLTTEGLSAPPVNMLQPLVDNTGRLLEPAEYSFASLNQDPTVAITLAPAVGDTSGHKWQLELDTNLELQRMTFGLVAPAGTTTSQMRFTGCNAFSGSPATRRICAASGSLGPYVNPAISYTVGPQASVSGLRTDTLYVSIGGARESGASAPALNVAGQPVVLGVVELDTSVAAPALTLDGVGTTSVFGTAYVDTSNAAVGTAFVQVGGGYNAPSDYDADGRSDDLDNCPYTANVTQANNGGFMTPIPDLYGDLCQCADGDDPAGIGTVNVADTAALRSALTGQATASVVSRCSVAGGPECDVRDYAVLKRALAGLQPGISSVCASAVRGAQALVAP